MVVQDTLDGKILRMASLISTNNNYRTERLCESFGGVRYQVENGKLVSCGGTLPVVIVKNSIY